MILLRSFLDRRKLRSPSSDYQPIVIPFKLRKCLQEYVDTVHRIKTSSKSNRKRPGDRFPGNVRDKVKHSLRNSAFDPEVRSPRQKISHDGVRNYHVAIEIRNEL